MFDKVTIAYRGAGYEIGQGRGVYGVWAVDAPRDKPLQRWAETPDGWSAAWTRFAGMEAPGTIVPVGRNNPPVSPDGSQAAGNPASPGQHAANERDEKSDHAGRGCVESERCRVDADARRHHARREHRTRNQHL